VILFILVIQSSPNGLLMDIGILHSTCVLAQAEAYISLNIFDGPFANAKSLMAKNVEIPGALRKMLCVFSALLLLSILKYNPDKAERRMNLIGVC
jgi:hypothetical protein